MEAEGVVNHGNGRVPTPRNESEPAEVGFRSFALGEVRRDDLGVVLGRVGIFVVARTGENALVQLAGSARPSSSVKDSDVSGHTYGKGTEGARSGRVVRRIVYELVMFLFRVTGRTRSGGRDVLAVADFEFLNGHVGVEFGKP